MLTISTLLLVSLFSPSPANLPERVPFADRAREYVERDDPAAFAGEPAEFDLGAFLARRFVQLDLGLYRVLVPSETLDDERNVERWHEAVLACAKAQTQLVELFGLGTEKRESSEAIVDWIESWKPSRMALVAAREDGPDRAAGWAADAGWDDDLAAHTAVLHGLFSGEEFKGGTASPVSIDMLLMPRREDFVDYVCFSGWLNSDWQESYWADGLAVWTHCAVADSRVIALEFANPSAGWRSGVSMNEDTATGLAQQVAQLALTDALARVLSPSVPAAFVTGLAMNLVVDMYGEVTTRVDGDLSSRSASAREVFVPGGASEGGVLPTNSAESRWRRQDGRNYFVRVLRAAQREGAEANRKERERGDKASKLRSFLLRNEAGGGHVVNGPFLGGAVEHDAVPAGLTGDQAEFLRAYPCAFLYWLRSTAAGRRGSAEQFSALLRSLVTQESVPLDISLAEHYGRALSDGALNPKNCLEGGFLAWLGKQKTAK